MSTYVQVDLKLETHRMRGDGAINSLCWTKTPDGAFLAVGGEDKHVVVWQIHERGEVADVEPVERRPGPPWLPRVNAPLRGDRYGHARATPTDAVTDSASTGSGTSAAYWCERALVLPRSFPVQCVCFSDVSLAFASGSLATYYGKGGNECHWSDRPAFDVIVTLSTV